MTNAKALERLVISVGRQPMGAADFSWLLHRGVRRFRLNMVRIGYDSLAVMQQNIEYARTRHGCPVETIFDLPGGKARLAKTTASHRFTPGERLRLRDAAFEGTDHRHALVVNGIRNLHLQPGDLLTVHNSGSTIGELPVHDLVRSKPTLPESVLIDGLRKHGVSFASKARLICVLDGVEWLVYDEARNLAYRLVRDHSGSPVWINEGVYLRVRQDVGEAWEVVTVGRGQIQADSGVTVVGRYHRRTHLLDEERDALKVAASLGAQHLALSFADSARLVNQTRQAYAQPVSLYAKVESPAAVASLRAITRAADGLVIARGDLSHYLTDAEMVGLVADIRGRPDGKTVRIDVASKLFRHTLKPRDEHQRRRDLDVLDKFESAGATNYWSDETSFAIDLRDCVSQIENLAPFLCDARRYR